MSTITYKLRTVTGDTLNLSNIPYGMSLEDETIRVYGSPGEDRIYVGPGLNLDLTILGLGNDKIFFTGALDDYTQTIDQDSAIYTFTHKDRPTEVVRVQSMGQNDVLYFADGHYVFNANDDPRLYNVNTWESFAITQAMLLPGGTPVPQSDAIITLHGISDDTGASGSDYVTSDNNGLTITASLSRPLENLQSQGSVGATLPMRIFIKGADGADIPYLGLSGQAMQIVGSAGVDNIYVGLGVAVDARVLGQGDDRIYFTGALDDYIQTIEQDSGVYTFTHKTRPTEVVRLTSMGENDELWFADGHIVFNAVTDTRLYDEVTERFMEVDASWLSAGGSPLVVEKLQYSNDGGITWQDVNHAIGANGTSITLHDPTLTSTANIQFRVINQVSSGAVTSQQVVIDTDAPATPVIGVIAGDDEIEALERPSATVQGTSEANAFIELSFSSGFVRQVQADGMGNWSYSLSAADFTAMGLGAESVTATATDLAGNTNGAQDQRSFNILTLDNTPPEITGPSGGAGAASSSDSVQENSTAVHTFTANEAVTWSLNGGVDAAHFSIDANTGELVFLSAPDYEVPTDDGADNTYTVVVRATDAAGNASNQTVTISVTGVSDGPGGVAGPASPVFTSGTAVNFAENGTGTAYTAVATDADGDSLVYSLSGTDAALFHINALTGAVTFKVAPNYEAPADLGADNVYDITVRASDGTHTTSQSVTISVTPVSDGPGGVAGPASPVFSSGTAVNFAENGTGTAYTAVATDADGDALLYSLSGTDAALFNINALTGAVTFKSAPDFEAPADAGGNNVYDIIVRASDGTHTTDQAVAITVTDVLNDEGRPVFTSGSTATVFEGIPTTTTVYDADATDDVAVTHYSLAAGGDNDLFNINSSTGVVTFKAVPSVAIDTVYNITVNAHDSEGSTAQAVAVTVKDLNPNPTISLGTWGQLLLPVVVEGKTYYVWDRSGDGTHDGGDAFTHNELDVIFRYSVNGVLETAGNAVGSVGDTDNTYRVASINGVHVALPTYGSTMSGISGSPVGSPGTPVYKSGTAVSNGAVNNPTYDDLLAIWDAHNGSYVGSGVEFALIGKPAGWLTQLLSATPAAGGHVMVDLSRGGVSSLNDAPGTGYVALQVLSQITSGEAARVAENVSTSAVVYDGEGWTSLGDRTLTWSIVGGADAARFTIDADDGEVRFLASPDHEAPTDAGGNNVYDIVVRATTSNGGFMDKNVAITVTPADVARPVFTSGSTATVFEGILASSVYEAKATDDVAVTHYSLAAGGDNDLFNINASTGVVTFKAVPSVAVDTVYHITVNAHDTVGSTAQAVAVTVKDLQAMSALSLGTWGQLILPVVVEGKTYYVWDRNASGTHESPGDGFTHIELDAIFRYDVNGVLEIAGNKVGNEGQTDNTYRYASINGVHVALPTYGGPMNGEGVHKTQYWNGTAVSSGAVNNQAYDDLLAIWDAYNGNGTGLDLAGVPPGWGTDYFWSATPHGHESILVHGGRGYVLNSGGQYAHQVALQVVSQITSGAAASVAENVATSVVVYDGEGWTSLGNGSLTWSIVGGADAARFTIDANDGEVRFLVSPDHEAPTDAGANNVYDIVVRATTSNGGFMDKNVAITVTNLEDVRPAFTSGTSVMVNKGITTSTTVYDADATDDVAVTHYSLAAGGDNELFNINSSTGVVTFKVSPNVSANTVYNITVNAHDSVGSTAQAVAVTVLNFEMATIDLNGTLGGVNYSNWNLMAPVAVGDRVYYVVDTNNSSTHTTADTVTHTQLDNLFNGGADTTNTDTTRTATLSTANGGVVKVMLPNLGTNTTLATANTYAAGSYGELWDMLATQRASTNGLPTGWDGGDTYWTASLSSGDNHRTVNLDDNTVGVAADAGANFVAFQVLGQITSVNTASVAENIGTGTVVLDANGSTPLGTGVLTWSLLGADAARFTIDADDGEIRFVANPDYESPVDSGGNNVYDIIVRATTSTGVTMDQAVAITVTNAVDAPVITSAATARVWEGHGTSIAAYDAQSNVEGGDGATYTLGGAHASLFNINASTGVVTFKVNPSVTSDTVYNIEITATNAAGSDMQAVDITVRDLAPTISLGTWGQLIAPVVVEGKTYYVWDRNGNGSHGDSFTHDELDAIFRYDINGVLETAGNAVGSVGNTDNTYRYATINGVQVALPVYGSTMSGINASPTGVYKNGTAVDNGTQNNSTYDGLLAIWDAHNGNGTATDTNGSPPGWAGDWANGYYWSATPTGAEAHAAVYLRSGYVATRTDEFFSHFVALEVL
jgi:hypothetical protein